MAETQNRTRVFLRVDDVDLGEMRTVSDFEKSGDPAKWRPGGLQDEKDFGGTSTFGDMTVTQAWILPIIQRWKWLLGRVNEGHGVITVQEYDRSRQLVDSTAYSGTLRSVKRPQSDPDSSSRGDFEAIVNVTNVA